MRETVSYSKLFLPFYLCRWLEASNSEAPRAHSKFQYWKLLGMWTVNFFFRFKRYKQSIVLCLALFFNPWYLLHINVGLKDGLGIIFKRCWRKSFPSRANCVWLQGIKYSLMHLCKRNRISDSRLPRKFLKTPRYRVSLFKASNFTKAMLHKIFFRSSHRRCSVRKSVLKDFAKFTGKHLC